MSGQDASPGESSSRGRTRRPASFRRNPHNPCRPCPSSSVPRGQSPFPRCAGASPSSSPADLRSPGDRCGPRRRRPGPAGSTSRPPSSSRARTWRPCSRSRRTARPPSSTSRRFASRRCTWKTRAASRRPWRPFAEIAADLRSRGLRVSGAVVPAGEKGPLCYNSPADMALLEGRVRVLAQAVDEIIVDDWLFTTCTCEKCVAERGSESWADYRSRLVHEQSKKHLIDVAKQVNPMATVIIKYPNWYEGHRQHGYDVALQTPQFDGVSVGIETRQRATDEQHIPIYSGYVFQRWIGGDAGPKWRSAWLDNYGMEGDANDYLGRGLAGGPCARPGDHLLVRGPAPPAGPRLRRLPVTLRADGRLRQAGRHAGRPGPRHPDPPAAGVHGRIQHLRLPRHDRAADGAAARRSPRTPRPPSSRSTRCATRSSRRSSWRGSAPGREVFLSWPLLRDLRESELGRVLNVIGDRGTATSSTFRVRDAFWYSKPVTADRPFTFPRSSSRPGPTCAAWRSSGRTRTSASCCPRPTWRARWTCSTCPTTATTSCGCRSPCSTPSAASSSTSSACAWSARGASRSIRLARGSMCSTT